MENQEYWRAIQEKICPRCIDADAQGNCRLPDGEECTLKAFLPQVVMAVANVKSSSMDAYVNALRRHVCILCDHQTTEMKCRKRSDLECSLDRYYPLVAEMIEVVRDEVARTEPRQAPVQS